MKKIFLITFLVMVAFTMTSCYPTKNVAALNSCIGATKANIYSSWGSPDRVTEDGNGGQIATYTKTAQTGGYAYTNNGITTYSAPQTRSNVFMLYFNSSNRVYQWKYFKDGKEIINR